MADGAVAGDAPPSADAVDSADGGAGRGADLAEVDVPDAAPVDAAPVDANLADADLLVDAPDQLDAASPIDAGPVLDAAGPPDGVSAASDSAGVGDGGPGPIDANAPDAATDGDGGGAESVDAVPDAPLPVLTASKYGFAALLSGKYAVIDVQTCKKVAVVGQGHMHVHGAAVLASKEAAWIPNADTKAFDFYQMAPGDPTTWTTTKSAPIGIKLGKVATSRDGKWAAITSGQMALAPSGKPAEVLKDVVFFSTEQGKVTAKVQTSSPNPVELSLDGKTAWVGNWVEHTLSSIDVAAGQVTWTVPLPQAGSGPWVGPSNLAVSHNGKWLVSCDLTDRKATLFDVDALDKPLGTMSTGKLLAHWCAFTPDDERVFVQGMEKFADEGDEAANVNIPSSIRIFDRKTLALVAEVKWTYSIWHVASAPGTPWVFASASWGSVLRYDANGQLTGQGLVDTGAPMPPMTISF